MVITICRVRFLIFFMNITETQQKSVSRSVLKLMFVVGQQSIDPLITKLSIQRCFSYHLCLVVYFDQTNRKQMP